MITETNMDSKKQFWYKQIQDWKKENIEKYKCDSCNFHTHSKTEMTRHCTFKKHLKNILKNIENNKVTKQ